MKLILTGDVPNLGAPGDIVEVKDGYGRNYLLPRGLAVVATRGAEKQVDAIRRARKSREIRDLGHAREVATQLGNLAVTVKVRLPSSPATSLAWSRSRICRARWARRIVSTCFSAPRVATIAILRGSR